MKSWNVEELKIHNNVDTVDAIVQVEEDSIDYLRSLQPQGQILVDSDKRTFVYILEDEESFVHLRFSSEIWNELAEVRKKELSVQAVFLYQSDNVVVPLDNFLVELNFILDNIRGNSNYGDEMLDAVESYF
ncbi:hypothetical protein ACERII_00630 [Evansella sp. AB-rgal1]|uniref:UPF0738 family protein n=1 Tax=Evansella sp. AB-rgal1 TaxID=3242696 RepID=UPI00359EF8E0